MTRGSPATRLPLCLPSKRGQEEKVTFSFVPECGVKQQHPLATSYKVPLLRFVLHLKLYI